MCKSGRFEKMEMLSIVKTALSYTGSRNKGRFYCSKALQPPFLIKALKGLHIDMLWCVNRLYLQCNPYTPTVKVAPTKRTCFFTERLRLLFYVFDDIMESVLFCQTIRSFLQRETLILLKVCVKQKYIFVMSLSHHRNICH